MQTYWEQGNESRRSVGEGVRTETKGQESLQIFWNWVIDHTLIYGNRGRMQVWVLGGKTNNAIMHILSLSS